MTISWPALVSCLNKRPEASRTGQECDDRLSELPEEIQLLIFSFFSIKEAAKLSLVSRRCTFLWRYVPLLIFEDPRAMDNIWGDWNAMTEERPGFVKWVDHVLDEHLGTVVDQLRITFDLDHNWQSHVDKWAAFAMDKQVKRLELNFSSRWRRARGIRKGGVVFPLCGEPLDLPPKFTNINSSFLKSLCLKYINVTDEFIDYLSLSCPLLENLCIEGSKCLTTLSCSLERVKHLEVSLCHNLVTIDISAPKLCSFRYYYLPIELLHIAHASSLVEVSIGARCGSRIPKEFRSLSRYFYQLVYLSMWINLRCMTWCHDLQMNLWIDNPPALPNLQHLELQVIANAQQSLQGWTSLIAASTGLHKLTLKLSALAEGYHSPVRKWDGFPLKCLETLQIVGYVGDSIDLELAFFVFENANMLEQVIIDLRSPLRKINDNDVREQRLTLLKTKLPQGVKLTVKKNVVTSSSLP